MDRIRAGLTGLGAVFLVTAAASLLFAPDATRTETIVKQEPGEPLAQLGVAPNSDKSGAANPGSTDDVAADPAEPLLEAQPSGGPPLDGRPRDPAVPSPAGVGVALDPGRPVAV